MNLSDMIKKMQELGYETDDAGMRENDMSAILKRLKFVFRDKIYKDRVDKSDKRWLDTEIDEVFAGIVEYLNAFE